MPYCNSNCSLTVFCIKECDDDDDDDDLYTCTSRHTARTVVKIIFPTPHWGPKPPESPSGYAYALKAKFSIPRMSRLRSQCRRRDV